MTTRAIKLRRGSMLIEVTMATVILIVIMSVALKVLGVAAHERVAVERRQRAVLEVANVMERLAADPFDEVTPERAQRMTLSDAARHGLPGCELKVDLSPSETAAKGGAAKRITVQLRWRDRSGEWAGPVRLTSWIYRVRARS